jgi:hypothetical protein
MIGSRTGCVKDAHGAGYAGRAPARVLDPVRPLAEPGSYRGAGSRLRHTPNQGNHGPKPLKRTLAVTGRYR